MENSDTQKNIRDRQTELVLIIEAIDEVLKTKGWQTLKELVWDKEVERIERLLLSEAKGSEINFGTIFRLQGELQRTRRYDLRSYAEMLKKELQGIKENQK